VDILIPSFLHDSSNQYLVCQGDLTKTADRSIFGLDQASYRCANSASLISATFLEDVRIRLRWPNLIQCTQLSDHNYQLHACYNLSLLSARCCTFCPYCQQSHYFFFYLHMYTVQHLDAIKVFYLPTDAQVNCLKNNFKIYIKIDTKTAPACFGVIIIIRERLIRSC
jgi:hypothetical protein